MVALALVALLALPAVAFGRQLVAMHERRRRAGPRCRRLADGGGRASENKTEQEMADVSAEALGGANTAKDRGLGPAAIGGENAMGLRGARTSTRGCAPRNK